MLFRFLNKKKKKHRFVQINYYKKLIIYYSINSNESYKNESRKSIIRSKN